MRRFEVPEAKAELPIPVELPARVAELKPLLISVRDFGKLCGCGKTEAFRLLREGRVRSCLLGRKRLVSYDDAVRLVANALESGSL